MANKYYITEKEHFSNIIKQCLIRSGIRSIEDEDWLTTDANELLDELYKLGYTLKKKPIKRNKK